LGVKTSRPITGYRSNRLTQQGALPILMPTVFRAGFTTTARQRNLEREMVRPDKRRQSGNHSYFMHQRGEQACGNGCSPRRPAKPSGGLLLGRLFLRRLRHELCRAARARRNVSAKSNSPLAHYGARASGWTNSQARNPRRPILEACPGVCVCQSECRVRWAERALAFNDKSNMRKKQWTVPHPSYFRFAHRIGSLFLFAVEHSTQIKFHLGSLGRSCFFPKFLPCKKKSIAPHGSRRLIHE